MATTRPKAKRVLKDISFEKDGAHIALTCKDNPPANGHDYTLVLKNLNYSKEFITKASMVKVEMEITEYLRKFYDIYWDDAEVLARALGFTTKEQEWEAQYAAQVASGDNTPYVSYIDEKVNSIQIIKSLKDAKNLPLAVSKLNENEYLALLQDQEVVEKALIAIAKTKSDDAGKTAESDASTNAGVEKSVGPSGSINQEVLEKTTMTEPVVEMVEKSQFVDLAKSLDDTKVELQKALDQIKMHEAEKKEAIVKAKTKEIADIVKDEAKVAILAKAALSLESEDDYVGFKAAITAMLASVETSEMFLEKGVDSAEQAPAPAESLVQKALKSQLAKTK